MNTKEALALALANHPDPDTDAFAIEAVGRVDEGDDLDLLGEAMVREFDGVEDLIADCRVALMEQCAWREREEEVV